MSSSLNIQHCQIIALNGYLLILPASFLLTENSTFNIKHQPMRKETIKKIINLIITVLTAIASAICVQSCK